MCIMLGTYINYVCFKYGFIQVDIRHNINYKVMYLFLFCLVD